jgi:SIR2-like domain
VTWFTAARHVLLTGAGFTQGYGGYLASEMWATIFRQPEIRADPLLHVAMRQYLNFEFLYDLVLGSGDYSPESQRAFIIAIRRAYLQMHRRIWDKCGPGGRAGGGAAAACRHIVARFAGKGRERGFFFTLNQDLFIEQFFPHDGTVPRSPGLETWLRSHQPGQPLDPENVKTPLPDEAAVEALKATFWDKGASNFVYVKLHGSLAWTGHAGDDLLVIGQVKSDVIDREPLLHWYLELFEEVLKGPNAYLVTMGYGFRDQHINRIIFHAIEDHGLRLCVVSPEDVLTYRQRMQAGMGDSDGATPYGQQLWENLYTYYQAKVEALCDPTAVKAPASAHELFESIDLGP